MTTAEPSVNDLSRVSLIASMYRAVVRPNDGQAYSAYERWSAAALPVRGQLERKRIASRDAIHKVLGDRLVEADVSTFTFAVESYLSFRARLLLHIASQQLQGETSRSRPLTVDVEDVLAGALVREAGFDFDEPGDDNNWLFDCILQAGEEAMAAEVATAGSAVDSFFQGPFTDLLGTDHQTLIPKQLRHATGAFYTPQWLARYTLQRAGYMDSADGPQSISLLDPTCGSGIFLIAAAEELRRLCAQGLLSSGTALDLVLNQFHGQDIDPLAAAQAFANVALTAMAFAMASGEHSITRSPDVACRDSLDRSGGDSKVDLVVGNPPWVNWEYLPPAYREKHTAKWQDLGIFELQGRERAWSKEDVSALFFAHSVDAYLDDGGKIAFLVPQSLVKAALNHKGFRSFRLRSGQLNSTEYAVSDVEDFVAVKPFEGVSNRTILMIAKKGLPTVYPLSYRRWLEVEPDSKRPDHTGPVRGKGVSEEAEPSNLEDITSHWTTGPPEALRALRGLAGESAFVARTGVFTGGANAVFHVEILKTEQFTATVRNVTERAKRQVTPVIADIERTFIYPLLRGREVSQWHHEACIGIVLPHTDATRMHPVPEKELADVAPQTLAYFEQFRDPLSERRGFAVWEQAFVSEGFYACQRIGDYTFSDWKVVWRYISPTFISAVVGPSPKAGLFEGKPLIPNEKLMSIACPSPEIAYFVGGLLASAPVIAFIESRMVSTQIAPHLLRGLRIPEYKAADPTHRMVSDLCRDGHRLVAEGKEIPNVLLCELDECASGIFGVEKAGAQMLRQMLNDNAAGSALRADFQ